MAKWIKYMLYKYFTPNLTHVTALPCETQMFSMLYNVEMYYFQQTIWRLNYHTQWSNCGERGGTAFPFRFWRGNAVPLAYTAAVGGRMKKLFKLSMNS